MSAVSVKLLGQTVRAATKLATQGVLTAGSVTAQTALLTEGIIRTMAMTKLKIAMIACLATGLLGVGGLTSCQADPRISGRRTRAAQ